MAKRTIEPYRDETLPERFLRWIETIRARFKAIPAYTESNGSPEGVVFGVKADRYFDLTGNQIYVKTTATGNTGWVVVDTGGALPEDLQTTYGASASGLITLDDIIRGIIIQDNAVPLTTPAVLFGVNDDLGVSLFDVSTASSHVNLGRQSNRPGNVSSVHAWHDGTNVFNTILAAAGGLEVNNQLTGVGLERVLTESDIPPAGFQGLGQWRYRTAITATPAAGRLQFDNVVINLATELYVNVTNDNGVDMSGFLALIEANDLLYIQISDDSSQYVVIETDTPTLAAGVYTFPILQAEGVGAAPTNNTAVVLVTTSAGSGAGGGGGGAAGTISYTYDNSLVAADPGSTFFRMNQLNPASVVQFRFSDDDINSADVQNILGNMVAGSYFIMRKADDNTQFRVYAITSIVDNAGWYQFNVNYLSTQSSGDNPIPNGSEILFEFFVSAMLAPTANIANQRPFAVWDDTDTRYEGSGSLITCNPNSPPLGGRLALGTTSGASITSPQILRNLGNADTYMDVIYSTSANNAFYQRYFRTPNTMSFGANISSVITDLLTFTIDAEVVLPLESALMFEGKGAAATDKTGHGQLYVSTADDGIYYKYDGDAAVRLDTVTVAGLLLANIPVADPPTTETPTGNYTIRDSDDTTTLMTLGFNAEPHLTLRNFFQGGEFQLDLVDSAGVAQNIIDADPDSGTTIRGDRRMSLAAGGRTYMVCDDFSGRDIEFFDDGVSVALTVPPASGGLRVNNLSTGGGSERVLTVSDLPGAAPVTSVFGRTGIVTALAADYDAFFLTPAEGDLAYGSLADVTANNAKVTNATHTGDATGSVALTIANNVVSNAKLADMAANTVKVATIAGDPVDLLIAADRILGHTTASGLLTALQGSQVNVMLPLFTSGLKGLAPASGGGTVNFLRADGTWAVPPGSGGGIGGTIANDQIAFGAATADDIEGSAVLTWDATARTLDIGTTVLSGNIELHDQGFIRFNSNADADNADIQMTTQLFISCDNGVTLSSINNMVFNVDNGQFFRLADGIETEDITLDNNGIVIANLHVTNNALFSDNDTLQFGSSGDVALDWTGTLLEVNFLASGQTWRFMDGPNVEIQQASSTNSLRMSCIAGVARFGSTSGTEVRFSRQGVDSGGLQGGSTLGVTSQMFVRDHNSIDHDVGFNDLQIFNDNVSDTLEANHAGQMAFKDTSTARTLTLAASGDLDFPVEHMTTVVNAFTSGNYTITEGAGTTLYYLDGSTRIDTAGGCTVGPGGVANIWRESATVYHIWGTGITP